MTVGCCTVGLEGRGGTSIGRAATLSVAVMPADAAARGANRVDVVRRSTALAMAARHAASAHPADVGTWDVVALTNEGLLAGEPTNNSTR